MHEQPIVKTIISQPISLEVAKEQLTVDSDFEEDDSLITRIIEDACDVTADMAGRDVSYTRCVQVILDGELSEYLVREPSFNALEGISYTIGGVTTEIGLDDVKAYKNNLSAKIILPSRVCFDELTITYTSGYTDSTIPRRARVGVLAKISDLYDIERGSYTIGTNFRDNDSFKKLLGTFIVTRF